MRNCRGSRWGRIASCAALAAVAWCSQSGTAHAEIIRDGADAGGPLDISSVKLGQHELRLSSRIATVRRLPRLSRLGGHPRLRGARSGRYLCLSVASPSVGRLLLCPAGEIDESRIDVGVSRLRGGRTTPAGSVTAVARRHRRSLTIDLRLSSLGLERGRLRFAALSGWSGKSCAGRESKPPAGAAACLDRAPRRGEGRTRIYPVRAVGCRGFSESKVYSGPRDRKEVALTFDDGPSAYTPQVLRILSDHHVNATFFEIGEQVPAYASTVRDLLAAGNELANHSLHHEDGPGVQSLRTTSDLIEATSGFRPCMFRPPGGFLPGPTLDAARSLGMVSVIWDVDTRDYTLPGTGAIASRATSVQPGSIVLMHDGGGPRNQTVSALPSIIENLKSRGFRLVTMTELLGGHYVHREVHSEKRRPLPDLGTYPARRPGP